MLSHFEMYLFVMLDSLKCASLVTFILLLGSSVMLGVTVATCSSYEKDKHTLMTKWLKRSLMASTLFTLLFVALPNTKQAAAIYLIPKIVNNENVQEIADNSLKGIRVLAEQWLEELAPVQKGKEGGSSYV